jgi:hypothetical protein
VKITTRTTKICFRLSSAVLRFGVARSRNRAARLDKFRSDLAESNSVALVNRILMFAVFAAALVSVATAQQVPAPETAPAGQAPPPARLPRDGFPTGPAARILSFTADVTSIQPGQSVTLKWAVVNADRIMLDQGIGIVTARGTRSLTPKSTTTYKLMALGYGAAGNSAQSVTVTVAGTSPGASQPASEISSTQPIPRMPDGTPDLSGIYIAPFMSIRAVEKVKLKPGAEKFRVGTDFGFDLTEHCLPPGVPGTTEWPYPLQIVQKPGLVLILYEAEHLFRVIPTDGQPHPADLDPTWMGNSVGRWDGDTLVVDVTGFNDKGVVEEYRHTAAYHVVERYRRTAYDKLSYEATIEDSNVFAAPWKVAGTMTLHPEWQIQEYVCEENNHNYKELFDPHKN